MDVLLIAFRHLVPAADHDRVTTAVYRPVGELPEFFTGTTIAQKSFFLLVYPALPIPVNRFYPVEKNVGREVVGVVHQTDNLSARLDGNKRGKVEPLKKAGYRFKAGIGK